MSGDRAADAARLRAQVATNPGDAVAWHNLASAEHALGRVQAARTHYEAAIGLLAKVRGRGHPDLALSQLNLAILHRDAGRVATARALLRRALATFRTRLGAAHAHTRACAAELAALR